MRGGVQNYLAAALGLALAAALSFGIALNREAEPVAATVLPDPMPLPQFRLTAGDGAPFTRDSLLGEHHLLFFGFTECPDVCPITLQQLAAMRRLLSERGSETLPDIVFVSVDPERDSVEAVAEYAQAFGSGVTGVRGELEALEALTRTLGVFHARPATEQGYTVEHSAAVFVIDDAARYSAVFSAPLEVDALVNDWPIVTSSR